MNWSHDAEGPPQTVLIIDDERQNRDVLEIMLKSEGLIVLFSVSGEDGLTVAEQQRPDLILLDIVMPGLDGYQVAAKLKANAATSHIPIIMVTALDDRNARILGLNAGAEDFLSMPVERAELQVRVRNLLRLKAYSDYHRDHVQMLENEVAVRTAELVESEQRYRQIVESTTDGIVKLDFGGFIVFANRRFAAMLGYDLNELVGKSVFSLMSASAEAVISAALDRRSQGVAEVYELELLCKDGTTLAVSVAATPILDNDGHYLGSLGSARDVTEQKRLLAQLTVSDRMASIGTLAAGVAHEINNPLACVMANLDLASRAVGELCEKLNLAADFVEVREELADAREATGRIRDIVRDLKIFSRSEEDKTGPVDVERVMESTLRMAWNEIRHRARLVKSYGETGQVEASEARLGQVFLNLVINAAQAIAEGNAKNNEIRIATSMGVGDRVVIEISDTGPGMPPAVLGQLFTPFFTTKPVGVGTGLGLSICHRIIVGFGGTIDVTSEVGKGTVFRISLPRARGEMPVEAPRPARPALVARRRGRILVVDDEPMIAKVIQRALSDRHEVVAPPSAKEALAQIRAGERFDVILCDLMMPEMTGMELHSELCLLDRDQADRMIFLTGGAFSARARAFLDDTPNQKIEKPFDAQHLRELINDRVR